MSTAAPAPGDAVRPGRRDLLLGGLAAAAAATAFAGMPRHPLMAIGKGQLDHIVPTRVGEWTFESTSGLVMPPPDQLAQVLYDQQITRSYNADSLLPVMLLMAYGSSQGGMLQIHRPEICYPASGFRLTKTSIVPLDIGDGRVIPTRVFTASGDERTERVLYWTRIGKYLPASWTTQRVDVMRENIAGYVPDGLLVRLSTVSQNADQAQAMLERFARAMLASVGPAGRRMLIGPDYA